MLCVCLLKNCTIYLLTPCCRVILEQLTGLQLVKKFPAFHGTRRFITALTTVRHLSLSWASHNPVHIPTSHLLEIHPNIIHPSTPRSPHWSLSLRFPPQDPIHPPPLTHTRHMPSPSHAPSNVFVNLSIHSISVSRPLHSLSYDTFLHSGLSNASSFNLQYPAVSLRSSGSYLRPLLRSSCYVPISSLNNVF